RDGKIPLGKVTGTAGDSARGAAVMPPTRRSVLASGGVPIRRICGGVLGSTVGSWLAGIRRPVLAVPPPGPELAWSGPGGWVLAYVSGIKGPPFCAGAPASSRGLAQDLAADTAGGGDDRELHGVLQVHRVSWARWSIPG